MKLTKYILSLAAAVGMISGCQKQELAQICAPEDAVAPVMEAVQDVVFTSENIAKDTLTISWAPLQYGVNLEINYTLEATVADGKPVKVASNIKNTSYVAPYEEINAILNYVEGLDLEAGVATEVSFRVSGQFSDYTPVYSEYTSAKFTVADAAPAVMNPYEGELAINADNLATGKAKFGWKPAVYGKNTPIEYSVAVGVPGSEKIVAVATGVKNPVEGSTDFAVEVKYSDINGVVLYDLEVPANRAVDIAYYVGAKIGEYATVYSEPVIISTTVTAAKKEYKKLTIVGSYQGWKPGIGQYVFDFGGEDKAYSGMIDFCADPAFDISTLEFKVVGKEWGDQECSVESGAAQTDEADLLTLVNGGGDNIKAYGAKRFYHFTVTKDASAPTLKKNLSFDQVGVIGVNGDWNNDIVMNFNASTQTFYADVQFTSDADFKFRVDADWAINWGVTDGAVVSGGGNIPVKAGNYRVYLNLNNLDEITYELNSFMYGQDESAGEPEPEPEPEPEVPALTGWGLVGAFSGWADGKDVMLTSDGTYLVAKGVALDGEFKFRKDGAWGTNFGLAEGAVFATGTEIALAQDGPNIVATSGTYDVYLDEANAKAWFITDGSYPGGGAAPVASEWGVVGQVNGWAAPDITMYKTSTEGLFVAYNVAMPDGGFKIRANGEWNDAANYGLEGGKGNVEVDHAYDVITSGGSGDMVLVAGNYDIWFDLTNTKVYIMTPGKPISEAVGGEAVAPEVPADQTWHMVGTFNSWNPGDEAYKMTSEGDFYVFKNFTAAEGCEVKFAPGEWNGDKGGDGTFAVNAANPTGGNNIAVPAGTYDVYLAKDLSAYYFMEVGKSPVPEKTWHMVGNFNSWNPGDDAYKMTSEGDFYVFKNFTAAEGCEAKFAPGEWSGDKGGDGTFAVGTANPTGGNNIAVTAGTYDVYLKKDLTVYYFMEVGKTPAN